MKRNTVHKILNPIIALLFISQVVSGLSHERLSEEIFEFIHEGFGLVLVSLVIVHFILNFNWIKASYFKPKI